MNTCIFCGAEAAVNLGTARASCNPCHDFVFSDVETIHQAFRLGALMAARVNVTGGSGARDCTRGPGLQSTKDAASRHAQGVALACALPRLCARRAREGV